MFEETTKKRKEKRRRRRLRKERKNDSEPLERQQEKEAPRIPASQNQSVKQKSSVFEPEKAQPDSGQIGREKQQVLDDKDTSGAKDSLMVERKLKAANSTPKPSATSTSSTDVNPKSNKPTATPKAVTVSSHTPIARETRPDSGQIGREKQQVLDDEDTNGAKDSLMVERKLKAANSTPKPSATSTSSTDINPKSNQPTATPKAVTVSSHTPIAREPGKKITEQSRSEREVPKASDPPGKTTKSGPDRPAVSAIPGSTMADEPENPNIRRSSTVPTGKTKDPDTTIQSKLIEFTLVSFTLTLLN